METTIIIILLLLLLYYLYIFKNVRSRHIKIRLEMENALLVRRIPRVPEDKLSVDVKIVSIAFKGKIIQIRVTVSASTVFATDFL